MSPLYNIGELVWYYCPYEEVLGIGVVIGYFEEDDNIKYRRKKGYEALYLEYIIYDHNTNILYGGFEDEPHKICLRSSTISALNNYDSAEEFIKSRGCDIKRYV
jgi:hypothetical protein